MTSPACFAAGRVQVVVTDRGSGMSPEVLRRIGEPFFTKEPGRSMGLGTFLARTLAERLGGRLTFQSSEGTGASAILEVPVSIEAQVVHEKRRAAFSSVSSKSSHSN